MPQRSSREWELLKRFSLKRFWKDFQGHRSKVKVIGRPDALCGGGWHFNGVTPIGGLVVLSWSSNSLQISAVSFCYANRNHHGRMYTAMYSTREQKMRPVKHLFWFSVDRLKVGYAVRMNYCTGLCGSLTANSGHIYFFIRHEVSHKTNQIIRQ